MFAGSQCIEYEHMNESGYLWMCECLSLSLSARFSMMSFVIVCLCICWFRWRAFVVTVLSIFITLHRIMILWRWIFSFFLLNLSLHAGFSFVPSHSIISIKCINKHNPLIKSHREKKSSSSSFYIDSKWLCQRAPSTKGLYTLFVYD